MTDGHPMLPPVPTHSWQVYRTGTEHYTILEAHPWHIPQDTPDYRGAGWYAPGSVPHCPLCRQEARQREACLPTASRPGERAPSSRGRAGAMKLSYPLEVLSMETTLYTLGHSTHPVPHVLALLALLTQHGITAVADVRSVPYSRRSPQFNRESLRAALAPPHIASVHVGALGARPNDPSCYVAGRVQYARLAATPAFQHGLTRLQDGMQRYRIALRCAEQEPLACHRPILIGRALRGPARTIQHILADGRLEAHAASAQRLVHLVGEVTDAPQALERAYEVQGHRIASTRYVISSWRAPS